MMESNLFSVMLFVIGSIFVGVFLKRVLKKSFLPYTVGLFLFGLAVGLCSRLNYIHFPKQLDLSLQAVSDMNPDIILYVFLPILIFDASLNLDIHIFKKTLTNASILAGPGVVVCLLLTGALMMGIQLWLPQYCNWTWTIALMFGSLISATDPVAVVALLKELNTSKRFSTLVDAESMLNDGTGIVFFMLFFSAFTAAGLQHGPFMSFLITVFGGTAIGGLLGWISMRFTRYFYDEPVVQNSILLVTAYLLFYLASAVFEVSGVIALVCYGLVVAYSGPTRLSAEANSFIRQFWELADFLANTLIFIIVGLIIAVKCDFSLMDMVALIAVYIGINAIRGVMIMFFYPLLRKLGYGLPLRESIILTWGGLRGALGMTLALLVYYTPGLPDDIRHQILFLTGGVVTLTLAINATTMGWLLRKLKLTSKPTAEVLMEYNIRKLLHEKSAEYLEVMKDKEAMEGTDWEALKQYLPKVETRPIDHEISINSAQANLRQVITEKSRDLCLQLYQNGVITAASEKRLTSLIESFYDYDGQMPLTELRTHFHEFRGVTPRQLVFMKWSSKYTKIYRLGIMKRYDFLRGFIILQKNALQLIDKLFTTVTATERIGLENIRHEVKENLEAAQQQMDIVQRDFPVAYRWSVNEKAKRMLLSKERNLIQEFLRNGMIDEDEAKVLSDQVG